MARCGRTFGSHFSSLVLERTTSRLDSNTSCGHSVLLRRLGVAIARQSDACDDTCWPILSESQSEGRTLFTCPDIYGLYILEGFGGSRTFQMKDKSSLCSEPVPIVENTIGYIFSSLSLLRPSEEARLTRQSPHLLLVSPLGSFERYGTSAP